MTSSSRPGDQGGARTRYDPTDVECAVARLRDERPARTALVAGDRRLSYAEFDRATDGFAAGLQELGVRRGDRVVIALPNDLDLAIAIYGTVRAGAAFSPVNPTIKEDKLGHVLDDCGAVCVVCHTDGAPVVFAARSMAPQRASVVAVGASIAGAPAFEELAERPAAPEPTLLDQDLAAVIYTSGSTGAPKGVTLTHRNMVFASDAIAEYLEMSDRDHVLCVLPVAFNYGLYQLLVSIRSGSTLRIEPGMPWPGRLIDILTTERVTALAGLPTLFRVLTSVSGSVAHDLPHLRVLTNAGAALSPSTLTAIRRMFPGARFFPMYGMTECGRISYLSPDQLDARPSSVGVPLPETEAWIQDDDGRRLGPGEIGELVVRGAHVMQGYWNDPVGTARRLQPGAWPWERVLRTGDLFWRDEEGFLFFVSRRDDMIKTKGEKVAPREVEDALLRAPGVRDVAVFGVPDELLGEAVHAHVSPVSGAHLEPAGLGRHCAARLEDHMIPKRIVIHAELPKTASGKVDRHALRAEDARPSVGDR